MDSFCSKDIKRAKKALSKAIKINLTIKTNTEEETNTDDFEENYEDTNEEEVSGNLSD